MHEQSTRKYFFIGLLFLSIIIALTVLWPFAKIIILSIALSAVLFPLYRWLLRYLKAPWVASLLTVAAFIIVLCIPLFTIGTLVFNQSQNISHWIADQGGFDNITRVFNRSIINLVPGGVINLKDSIESVTHTFTMGIGTAFTTTLATLFGFLLVVLSVFYFLKDGTHWKQTILRLSPLSDESGHKIIEKLNSAVNGIVKGYLFVGIVQGVLMGIGLSLFGVPNAALWGVVAGIASLVPTVGTALISVPAIIFLFVMERTGAAIGLLVWAAALVGTIDNMLNPFIVGKKIEIHPLLVLFSVLGGIATMGPLGILIGPLAISFVYALVSVYKTETA